MSTPTDEPDPWAQAPRMSPEQGGQAPPPGWGMPPQGPPPQGYPPGAPPSYNPPPGAPPGWGAQPPGGYYAAYQAPRNGLGTASMVLGILGLLTFFIGVGILLGIVAVILGFIARGRATRGQATNGGAALAGIICGALGAIGGIVLFAFVFSSSGFSDYRDCIRHANTVSERQDCQDQFRNDFG